MALKKPILSTAGAAAASRRAARLRAEQDAAQKKAKIVQPARRGPVQKPTTSRRRVRDETRAQMLERLTNPQISVYEASILLRVCTATIRRYSDSGELPHARTEGRQRRFYLRDVLELLHQRESDRG